MAETIGFIAIKGGVGKTTCTANIGASLAYKFNKKVLLVDANFTAPNLGFYFDIFDPKKTIHDVLQNKVKIEDAIVEYNEKIHIIPGALCQGAIKKPLVLDAVLKKVKDAYDIILIDSSPNIENEILFTINASDVVYTVTTPDFPTLSTTLRLLKLTHQKKNYVNGLILNKVKYKKYELEKREIEKTAEAPVIGVIPNDWKVEESLSIPKPLPLYAPKSNAAVAFNSIAAMIIDEDYKDPRFLARLKNLFMRR